MRNHSKTSWTLARSSINQDRLLFYQIWKFQSREIFWSWRLFWRELLKNVQQLIWSYLWETSLTSSLSSHFLQTMFNFVLISFSHCLKISLDFVKTLIFYLFQVRMIQDQILCCLNFSCQSLYLIDIAVLDWKS